MEQKYQCHICMQVANKPVVTPCGHLFCWVCIYHWLRSNQQYLTCPICKNGLQMTSLRSLVTPHDIPEKFENGIPPRPRLFFKGKINQSAVKQLPKSIKNIGMNNQRGVLLAGYGLFPSLYLTIFSKIVLPKPQENALGENPQLKYTSIFNKILYALLGLLILIILFS